MTGGQADESRGIAGESERENTDAVIYQIEEIENEDVGQPAKEAESEQVDRQEEKLDDGREEKVEDYKNQ